MSTIADVQAVAPSFRGPDLRDRPWVDVRSRGGTAQDSWWVQLAELDAALDVIDGLSTSISIGTIALERNVPLEHRWLPNTICDGYRVEEYASSEEANPALHWTGPQAKITVYYRQLDYSLTGEEAYQRVSARGFHDEIPADGVAVSGGGTPRYTVNRLVPGLSYRISVFDAPGVDEEVEALWAANAGSVNSAAFRGNAPGTVLYQYPEFDYVFKRDGSRTCNYNLQFDVRRIPWNSLIQNGSVASYTVGGQPNHPAIDLNTLFK